MLKAKLFQGDDHMLDSVSPYALLSASKPKRAPSVVTAYDLYSMAQGRSSDAPEPAGMPRGQETPPARAAQPAVYPQPRKTHYISDIHTRHTSATSRTSMLSSPLPPL